MDNKFISTTTIAAVLLLTMCSSLTGAKADQGQSFVQYYKVPNNDSLTSLFFPERKVGLLEYDQYIHEKNQEQKRLHEKRLNKNLADLTVAIENTKKYVNKTWYVFSGSTPKGWDCSGLVLWTYSHLGFNLYHSATSQMNFGDKVKKPKYGDLVGFKRNGSSMYYHVGIYISDDTMLHSGGKKGDRTELTSISNFAGNHSKVEYSRVVPTAD